MIEGQSITRPDVEVSKFYTWFTEASRKAADNIVVTMPNDIKTLFTTWLNAFNNLPAQNVATVEYTMLKGDHTALLNELNSRAEDYYNYLDYLSFFDEYNVPAGSGHTYEGQHYYTPMPTLLYYDGSTKRRNITTDFDQDIR